MRLTWNVPSFPSDSGLEMGSTWLLRSGKYLVCFDWPRSGGGLSVLSEIFSSASSKSSSIGLAFGSKHEDVEGSSTVEASGP